MSVLSDKQRLFAEMVGELLRWIYANGYAVTFGDAYRDPRVHGIMGQKKLVEGKTVYGRKNSNHKQRLAIDLNLFRKREQSAGWEYMTTTEDHKPVGEYWESLGGAWGGRFDDGNHYSLEHEGRR